LKGEAVQAKDAAGAKFTFRSKDGDEGYPGTLDVTVTFLLTEANEVRIEYSAKTSDKPTVLNLTTMPIGIGRCRQRRRAGA